jgi:hypothetical protein
VEEVFKNLDYEKNCEGGDADYIINCVKNFTCLNIIDDFPLLGYVTLIKIFFPTPFLMKFTTFMPGFNFCSTSLSPYVCWYINRELTKKAHVHFCVNLLDLIYL